MHQPTSKHVPIAAAGLALALPALVVGLAAATAHPGTPPRTTIEAMPAELEERFALSALPPALRGDAAVYVLEPEKGYRLARKGTSGLACLVQRTVWDLADYRDDIYYPLCYDPAGAPSYLRVVLDAAALRAQGLAPVALKEEMTRRWADRTYVPPAKAGLSYMVGPVMRTVGPPDLEVHTMAMPHLMFYAPFLTNADIGAKPDLADPASLLHPFVDRQGIAEHTYIIQLVGEAEKARILVDEKGLIEDLCAYRDVLCLPGTRH